MLPPKVSQLVQEIFSRPRQSEDTKQGVKEDPERYLVSLLEAIKERLPVVSATLEITVEHASGKIATENWEATKKRKRVRSS